MTIIVDEGTKFIQLYCDDLDELRSLEETLMVVHGCKHFEGVAPENNWYTACENLLFKLRINVGPEIRPSKSGIKIARDPNFYM